MNNESSKLQKLQNIKNRIDALEDIRYAREAWENPEDPYNDDDEPEPFTDEMESELDSLIRERREILESC